MTSFRSILESSNSTIDRLWDSLEIESKKGHVDNNDLLILSDAYLDLSTEEGDLISKGLKVLVSRNKQAAYDSVYKSYYWTDYIKWKYRYSLGADIILSMQGTEDFYHYNQPDIRYQTLYYNSFRNAMISAAKAIISWL